MRSCVILLLALASHAGYPQSPQADINTQVWLPFINTFNSRDAEGFMALHSKDAVRSPRDSKAVWNWSEYRERMVQSASGAKESGRKVDLQLHFTERIAGGDLAVEVGVYKTTAQAKDGNTTSYYGKFHVVLRKENGTWKILVDTDSSEGETIGEKEFLSAKPLDYVTWK
ncbi:MAG: nuclear transport factor 2 family protein [Bacteroidia bacterium]|nr:nuclear transport factor 2 family protein [Bacteroidia bacterium]